MTREQIERVQQLETEAYVNGLERDEVRQRVDEMIDWLREDLFGPDINERWEPVKMAPYDPEVMG